MHRASPRTGARMNTLIYQFKGGMKAVISSTYMPVTPPVGTVIMYEDGELEGCAFEVVGVFLKPDRAPRAPFENRLPTWRQEIQVKDARAGES